MSDEKLEAIWDNDQAQTLSLKQFLKLTLSLKLIWLLNEKIKQGGIAKTA